MTGQRHRARLLTTIVVILAASMLYRGPAQARDSAAYGEYVKAARMLRDWRYDEARERIAKLDKKWPKVDETLYLKAELAFLDGDYPRSLQLLDGMNDSAVHDQVGKLRALVASTLAVTKDFDSRESSGGHFVIYFPPGKEELIADLAGDALERAYDALGKDLGYYPQEKVRVEIMKAPADLARVSALTETDIDTSGTIALCKYGKLMVVTPRATIHGYSWMDTLAHEYVHYVVSRMSHDTVPVWLHEGLARFEQTRWRKAETGKLSPTDEHLLAAALKKRRLISFKQMHPSMAKLPSQQAVALAFAEVYTMVTYLHGEVGYEGIRQIIARQRDGKSAARAIAEVTDTRWGQVKRDWKKYLRSAKLKTSRALAGRAGAPRVRFDKGGEKDENIGIEAVANKQAAKFTRLGGMLRMRDMPEAAAVEYEKALAIVPEDPFVAGKLSRTYLELQQYDKAIELAEPLAELDEADALPTTTLGLAYLASGDLERARAAFEGSLRVSPFDPAVRCGLAEVYAALAESILAKREDKACQRLGH